MNLYADTSALVKRYIQESESQAVTAHFQQYPFIATSAITPVEMASAFAKAGQQGWVDSVELSVAWGDFLTDWPSYLRLPISNAVIDRATSIAWQYRLRAYDSLHLACALTWKELLQQEVIFACFDRHLLQAAHEAGLAIWPAR